MCGRLKCSNGVSWYIRYPAGILARLVISRRPVPASAGLGEGNLEIRFDGTVFALGGPQSGLVAKRSAKRCKLLPADSLDNVLNCGIVRLALPLKSWLWIANRPCGSICSGGDQRKDSKGPLSVGPRTASVLFVSKGLGVRNWS